MVKKPNVNCTPFSHPSSIYMKAVYLSSFPWLIFFVDPLYIHIYDSNFLNFPTQNFKSTQLFEFFMDFKNFIYLKRKLSPLELSKNAVSFIMRESGYISIYSRLLKKINQGKVLNIPPSYIYIYK